MITISLLFILAAVGGILTLIDGVLRARGRGTAILAVIEIIVGALFLLSLFFPGIPFGSLVLAVVALVVMILQLLMRGSTRRAGIGLTIAAILVLIFWIVLAQHWIVIAGIN